MTTTCLLLLLAIAQALAAPASPMDAVIADDSRRSVTPFGTIPFQQDMEVAMTVSSTLGGRCEPGGVSDHFEDVTVMHIHRFDYETLQLYQDVFHAHVAWTGPATLHVSGTAECVAYMAEILREKDSIIDYNTGRSYDSKMNDLASVADTAPAQTVSVDPHEPATDQVVFSASLSNIMLNLDTPTREGFEKLTNTHIAVQDPCPGPHCTITVVGAPNNRAWCKALIENRLAAPMPTWTMWPTVSPTAAPTAAGAPTAH